MIRCLAWNTTSDLLAFAGEDDNWYGIDVNEGYKVCQFSGHDSFVSDLSFDVGQAEKLWIFSAAQDSMVGCWDLTGDNPTRAAMIGPFVKPIRSIACFRKVIVTVDSGGSVICWRRTR
jgi:WD40 repeat protein